MSWRTLKCKMYTSSPRSTMLSKAHHPVSFSSCAVQTEMYSSQLYSWEMRGFPAHSKPKLTASVCVYVCLLADLCAAVSLCDPMDCSPPGSSVCWILQARILEWVAISSSTGSSQPRGQTQISCIGRWVLYNYCHHIYTHRRLNTIRKKYSW